MCICVVVVVVVIVIVVIVVFIVVYFVTINDIFMETSGVASIWPRIKYKYNSVFLFFRCLADKLRIEWSQTLTGVQRELIHVTLVYTTVEFCL